jgi:putative aldouronate transport system permease protein
MASVAVSAPEFVVRNQISFFPRGFQLDALNTIFEDSRLWVGYRNTLLYVSLFLPISMSLTIAAAYALSRRDLVFRTPVMLMLVFTLMFNGGMIPFYLVARSYGLIDTIWAVVLPNAINTIYLIIMRTFFQGLPKEIEESGRVDGL